VSPDYPPARYFGHRHSIIIYTPALVYSIFNSGPASRCERLARARGCARAARARAYTVVRSMLLLGPKLALTLLYPLIALLALHGGTVVGRERFDQAEAAALRYSAWVWGDDCVTRGQEHWGEHWARFFDGLREIGVQGPGRRLYVSAGHIVANTSGFQNFFDFTRAASEQGLGIELLFVQHDPWNVAAEKMVAQAELSCDLITACRTAAAGPAQCPVAIHYDLVRHFRLHAAFLWQHFWLTLRSSVSIVAIVVEDS
jgi:hypothetical protein